MRAPRPAGRPHPVDPKLHSNRAEDTIQDNSGRRRPHNRERSSHEGASDPPSARFRNLGTDRSRPARRPIVIPRLLPGHSARPGDESQPIDPFQDRCEQPPRHGHLGHLERHGSGTRDHLGPDLDQLLPQCRQAPVLHPAGQRHLPQEVAQVV